MTLFARPFVFFDLDGTLVDTRAAVLECYTRVYREHLHADFPPASIPAGEVFAMRPAELFARVAPDRVAELYEAYRVTYPSCIDRIAIFPRVAEMIGSLVESGRKPGLVTNKGLERTLIDLSVAGIPESAFCTIVTAEDTVERKPDPAPILLALERTGASPGDGVYVGDGPQDILAARAAGMPCVALTYGFYGREDLLPYAPDALVDNARDLAAVLGADLPEVAR